MRRRQRGGNGSDVFVNDIKIELKLLDSVNKKHELEIILIIENNSSKKIKIRSNNICKIISWTICKGKYKLNMIAISKYCKIYFA